MPEYPRALHQPPAGRPHWVNEGDAILPLHYLAWGSRAYGRHPIPISEHAGWTYQLITQGETILLAGSQAHPLRSGMLALIGPGCPSGWAAKKITSRCRIVTWIWPDPPLFAELQPSRNGWKILLLSGDLIKELEKLHRETRSELIHSDAVTPHALQSLKLRVDILLARLPTSIPSTDPVARLKLAQAWLRDHPEILSPVSPLCDLLGISAISLNRLFRQHLQKNVREFAYSNRMDIARAAVRQPGCSIKEIALRLGYSQANDFTRAYTTYWHESPSLTRTRTGRTSCDKFA